MRKCKVVFGANNVTKKKIIFFVLNFGKFSTIDRKFSKVDRIILN